MYPGPSGLNRTAVVESMTSSFPSHGVILMGYIAVLSVENFENRLLQIYCICIYLL